ncbi:MAG: ROK family protein [Clostridia bacterium]|nr:ROK family protein [Clostridia bacterium]MBO7152107.1 ROK family protein [Clostridia bacterium]MBO7222064.1 ROK family protein [Clostridia bacterium]
MYYIGIDVGGMSIKAGIIDENGNILRQQFIVTVPDKPSDEIVEQIAVLIEDIAKEHKLTMADIAGIGLGFPGSVWDQKGEIVYCCNINLVKVPVVKMLTARLGVKNIKISNDANCAALAETRFGAGKGAMNSVMITLGTGLGTGIVVDGKLLTGNRSAGAEGGHMQINFGGPTCGCGKKGHYEAYASATALIEQTKQAMAKHPESVLNEVAKIYGINGKTVFIAAKQGDKVAVATLNRYIKYIGIGLVNFANLFYPEVMIIGGGVSRQGDVLVKPLQRYVSRNVYGSKYNPKIKVVAATLGNEAGIIGAACLAMN